MLLLDNSAWARLGNPALGEERRIEIAEMMRARDIGTCLPFLLEAGYSARSGPDYDRIMRGLSALPHHEMTPVVEGLAKAAQRALARQGHHRLAPTDIVIAALAHHHHAGVLHYDKDYDLLLEYSGLRFESEWLAPRGAL